VVASAYQLVEDSRPAKTKKRKPQPHPDCAACAERAKPRHRMPLSHAHETVVAILIRRLDGGLEDLERIALRVAGDHIDDAGVAMSLAVAFIQEVQVLLFPEEFADGPEYTPSPDCRMDVPPVFAGLVPKIPQLATYARHLLKGKGSPVSKLTTTVKDKRGDEVTAPLFTDAELARLGERQERRAVACEI
jgi:hypothetical protein